VTKRKINLLRALVKLKILLPVPIGRWYPFSISLPTFGVEGAPPRHGTPPFLSGDSRRGATDVRTGARPPTLSPL